MALPASGSAISLNQVNVELAVAGTTSINMNQATLRTLFATPSGAISMSNGYGKSNAPSITSIVISGTTSFVWFTSGTSTWTVLITYSNGSTSTDCTLLSWSYVITAGYTPGSFTITTANVKNNTTGSVGFGSGYVRATNTATGVYGQLAYTTTCLPLKTLITMADGTQKKMGEIVVGDLVKAVDPFTEEFSNEIVTFLLNTSISHTLIQITCEDNIVLEPTPEHEVWIKRDGITLWSESKDVVVGDELLSDDLTYKKVISVEPINYPEGIEVGNISVANAKVYFAERLLMHNTGL